MNILVTGANGFLGRSIVEELGTAHTVFKGTRSYDTEGNAVHVDLTDPLSIEKILEDYEIDAIINAAGIVDAADDYDQNELFTRNLLTAVVKSKRPLKRIIVTGSAAEYGVMPDRRENVPEAELLRADNGYGLSKVNEEKTALGMREKNDLPVVIARVFNPIGSGMKPRFLVPGIINQVKHLEENSNTITINRLDAKRDYVDVRDVARAYRAIIEGNPSYSVYNIGSGKATSNAELLDIILHAYKLTGRPEVTETSSEPEPNIATCANISRIHDDLGWYPQNNIKDTIERIVKETDEK